MKSESSLSTRIWSSRYVQVARLPTWVWIIAIAYERVRIQTFGALSEPEEITETENDDPGFEVPYSHSEESLEPPDPHCAICLEDMERDDKIGMAPNNRCPHYYHKDCIYAWLLVNEMCPKCRYPFLCDDDEIPKREERDEETGRSESGR